MAKNYGLLIGVTYPNTHAYLPGCDNDVLEIYNFLKDHGYNEFDVLCDTEIFEKNHPTLKTSRPSFRNIVTSLFKLLHWARKNPDGNVFLHYSGHGTQVADKNWVFDSKNRTWKREEEDGRDECIVTEDLRLISDDQLKWLFSMLPETINMFSLMDSCHSGSAFDLKYYLKSPNESVTKTTQNEMKASIVMISGCKDDQYSQSSVFNGKWYGVMSYAFLYLMNYMKYSKVNEIPLCDFWRFMGLICANFPQIPQASCSKNLFSSLKIQCSENSFSLIESASKNRSFDYDDSDEKYATKKSGYRSWSLNQPKEHHQPAKQNNYYMKMKM